MRTQKIVKDQEDKLRKLSRKDYRDGYLHSAVRTRVAYQIRAIRHKLGLTQKQMAERTGKTQSVISRLENIDYDGISIQSLLDIASALDIALTVKFTSYPDFLRENLDVSEAALLVQSIYDSLDQIERKEVASNMDRIVSILELGEVHQSIPKPQEPSRLATDWQKKLDQDSSAIRAKLLTAQRSDKRILKGAHQ